MVKIKICGITNLDDARVAVQAGADMLGFNFYRPSPRFIDPAQAREIIQSLREEMKDSAHDVSMVGVFVNEPIDSLLKISSETGVDAVQLHGDESIEFCAEFKARASELFAIKVFRINQDVRPQTVNGHDVDAIMLDAFDKKLFGGTGRVIDWSVAASIRTSVDRLFLSGGLSPANVADAIRVVRPYGVDACSALESLPGRKDAERVKAFVRAARGE